MSVIFKPTTSGTRTGTLTVTDNAENSPQTITLSGVGSFNVVLSPANLNFGVQPVGITSPAQKLTLANRAAVSTPIKTALTGDFHISSTTCGASLGPLA
ncbi:MAG TPA: hypothetical protein VLC12_06395, partial [Terriglobales bacterium]|nr:hypothetical protein [Terriglobales bacterium]